MNKDFIHISAIVYALFYFILIFKKVGLSHKNLLTKQFFIKFYWGTFNKILSIFLVL